MIITICNNTTTTTNNNNNNNKSSSNQMCLCVCLECVALLVLSVKSAFHNILRINHIYNLQSSSVGRLNQLKNDFQIGQ